MEQPEYNLLFRWFVGLGMDDPVWDPTVFTKNREARNLPMTIAVFESLRAQRQLRDRRYPSCPYVFFNHDKGTVIRDFRQAWKSAARKAGVPGLLFHDLRRNVVSLQKNPTSQVQFRRNRPKSGEKQEMLCGAK